MIDHQTIGRKPRYYAFKGGSYTMKDLSAIFGIPARLLYKRTSTLGMTIAEAIALGYETKPTITNKPFTFRGQTMTIKEWAEQLGVNDSCLRTRLRAQGLTVEQALAIPTPAQRRRGVVSNLQAFEGTGAGSSACESPDITFQEEALSA